jgi:hypothetical protein
MIVPLAYWLSDCLKSSTNSSVKPTNLVTLYANTLP